MVAYTMGLRGVESLGEVGGVSTFVGHGGGCQPSRGDVRPVAVFVGEVESLALDRTIVNKEFKLFGG